MILSNSKRLSLWLLPPEPLRSKLSSVQEKILSDHDLNELPKFVPHITLIGGVPISECVSADQLPRDNLLNGDIDEEGANIVLNRLQDAFRGFGGIKIDFDRERGVFAARNPPVEGIGVGSIQWNQSCVCIAKRTDDFMRAMQLADDVLFPSNSFPVGRHFRTPLFEPHYSYLYGNHPDHIPSDLDCPPSFQCTEMLIMWTYPSDLEGVKLWKEIGVVRMD